MTDDLAFKVTLLSDLESALEAVIKAMKTLGVGGHTRINVRATILIGCRLPPVRDAWRLQPTSRSPDAQPRSGYRRHVTL